MPEPDIEPSEIREDSVPRMPKLRTTEPGGLIRSTIQTVLWWFKVLGVYLTGQIILLLVISKYQARVGEILGISSHRIIWILALAPLLLALLFKALPAWRRRRRQQALRKYAIATNGLEAEYFRLGPYNDSPQDQRLYVREDRAHERMSEWILGHEEPLLFLTGLSGSGKSSLLNAYVIPRLRDQELGWRVIVVRSFSDPLKVLRNELLKPGVVWDRPPSQNDDDLFEVLKNAACYCRSSNSASRVMLVFDQFEEFLVLNDPRSEIWEQMRSFFARLLQQPISGLLVLLVCRTEYMIQLHELELPHLRERENWHEVPAFTEAAARRFLKRAEALQIGPDLLDEFLSQMLAWEDTPGLVRPVILNMVGLVVSQSGRQLQDRLRRGNVPDLLVEWVVTRLRAPTLRDYARPVLRELVTNAGTRQPRTLADLSARSRLDSAIVRGSLVLMSREGLVRCLNTNTLPGSQPLSSQVWEISHDFLARLLNQVLATWRTNWWEKIRPWMAPVSLFIWTVGLSALAFSKSDLRSTEAMVAFANLGASVKTSTNEVGTGARVVTLVLTSDSLSTNALIAAQVISNFFQFQRVLNLQELTVTQSKISTIPGLERLTSLKRLNVSFTEIEELAGLEKLTSLQLLDANHTKIGRIPNLGALSNLQSLDLSFTNIKELDGIEKLSSLQNINLNHTNVRRLPNLRQLIALTRLDLSSSDLEELPILASPLVVLDVTGCTKLPK